MFKQAIIEQWQERFGECDPEYAEVKIRNVKECKGITDLILHCLNIDFVGRAIIANKMKSTPQKFALFLAQWRSIWNDHNWESSGHEISYLTEKFDEGFHEYYSDGTVDTYVYKRKG